jgi:protein-tyrosine phosphatase
VVRSDAPANLTARGWSALRAHGIRTIVDLRNDEERTDPVGVGAAGVATVHVPMDDIADGGFWQQVWDDGLDGTPLYYRPFLERKPERCVAAVADARPAACWSTAGSAGTAPAWSRRCSWPWSGWLRATSPTTTT